MKIGFYAFYSQKNKSKDKSGIKMLDFLLHQATHSNSLSHGADYLYLHNIDNKTFLFTKTNDNSLIQKINRSSASIEDIKKSLADDESLGFPAFVFVDEDVIGFARTVYGPTTTDLIDFLHGKNIAIEDGSKVQLEPLMKSTTKKDVMTMSFIGRTTVKIESNTTIFVDIMRALGAKDIEDELFDSIEVIIKPKHRRDIKSATRDIVNNPNPPYSEISMRAREEAGDILSEHYLSEKGHLSAIIEKATNAEIAEEMSYCFTRMKSSIVSCFNRQIGTLSR
ncbi:protein rexA [Symbiopectobacterium sp. RP]|uniref:protein rexA n=1 Tax=Symbiopectobacterium sp. RP TaxID=3248553 RepID=UPI003D297E72